MTQNKSKTHKLCKNKNTKRKKKVIESLGALFLPHLGRTFLLIKPLNRWWGERIETIQVRKEHEGFEKISKGSKKRLKLILASRCYHTIALLSGYPLIAIWSCMTGNSTMMTKMLLLLFRLLRVNLLSPKVFSFLLILLRGCS